MTRGIRNNNPLNIRRSKDRWEGAERANGQGIRAIQDIGVSVTPNLSGTTFCHIPADDLLMWDEYRDW